MADRWIPADELVRAMGGRDHLPVPQPARDRLSEAEVLKRRANAAERDWSKVGEPEPERKPRPKRRSPRFRSR